MCKVIQSARHFYSHSWKSLNHPKNVTFATLPGFCGFHPGVWKFHRYKNFTFQRRTPNICRVLMGLVGTTLHPVTVTTRNIPFLGSGTPVTKPSFVTPIGSMYGIFTYIYHKFMPNVGKYSIHGSYGTVTGWGGRPKGLGNPAIEIRMVKESALEIQAGG